MTMTSPTDPDTSITPAIHGRCATISTTTTDMAKELETITGKQAQRSRSARTSEKVNKKESMTSNNSTQSENLEDSHPTDCSWISSSTSSSCRVSFTILIIQ